MSSRLLPRHTQVATYKVFAHTGVGSRLTSIGSRRVAGWVAGWDWRMSLAYDAKRIAGSRCSTFLQKVCARNRRTGREHIGVTIGVSCYTCYPDAQANGPQNFRVHRPDGAA